MELTQTVNPAQNRAVVVLGSSKGWSVWLGDYLAFVIGTSPYQDWANMLRS